MKPLQPFEFTPKFQPVPEDPVVFTLKPLDFAGQYVVGIATAETESGLPGMTGIRALPDYVIGWKGGGLEEKSGAEAQKELRKIISGGPNRKWGAWLLQIMMRLMTDSEFSEDEAKKS